MLLNVCVSEFMCVCSCVLYCKRMCRGQKVMSGIFLFYFWRQDFPGQLRLSVLVRLALYLFSEIYLSLLPSPGLQINVVQKFFMWVLEFLPRFS